MRKKKEEKDSDGNIRQHSLVRILGFYNKEIVLSLNYKNISNIIDKATNKRKTQ